MKKGLIPVLMLSLVFLFWGCSKDEDVAELEKEVKEVESADYLADTGGKGEVAEGETVPSTMSEYAMTPEKTPEEETAYEPESPYAGAGGFTVQVAAGADLDNVNYLMDKFVTRGYEPFMTRTVVDGVTYYRVRIGNFETLAAAKEFGNELKDIYSVDFWIDYNR
jgi:cell division septation protein DedD